MVAARGLDRLDGSSGALLPTRGLSPTPDVLVVPERLVLPKGFGSFCDALKLLRHNFGK